MYPGYELHRRVVRKDDLLSFTVTYGGRAYWVRMFDARVIYWCEIPIDGVVSQRNQSNEPAH